MVNGTSGVSLGSRFVVVSGLPGSGKSAFASALPEELDLLFLELDLWRVDAMRHHRLSWPWLLLSWFSNPWPFAAALERRAAHAATRGVVVSLPSHQRLRLPLIHRLSAAGIHVLITHGPAQHCLRSFLEREHRTGRHLGVSHWMRYSRAMHRLYATSGYEPLRLKIFASDGSRRPMACLLADARARPVAPANSWPR